MLPRLALMAFSFACCWQSVAGEALVPFQSAAASSTIADTAFAAEEALRKGSGYWCSSGAHPASQTVTWTGRLAGRQHGIGLKLQWSYAPGEVKVLTSSDGSNFEDAACWRSAQREEIAFGESIMFETPRDVKAVMVVMRDPQPWAYFGISFAALIAQPGPVMMVSSSSAAGGEEMCLASAGDARRTLTARPCLQTLVNGAGEEAFRLTTASQLQSVSTGLCVAAVGQGSELQLGDCTAAREANDGRSIFEMSASGQLRMPELGDVCVQMVAHTVATTKCSADGTEFGLIAIPELDEDAAAVAKDVAQLVVAAAARQQKLLQQLSEELPKLAKCSKVSLSSSGSRALYAAVQSSSEKRSPREGDAVISSVGDALGLNVASIRALLAETASVLDGLPRLRK